ncbi:MAG: vitamin B12-dependent ribonucleotide reductase, partial [Candidatus Saccharimonadales bacterium]
VELGELYGVRNSQASVLAPTGTIGLMMDCDTTGIEPDLGLVKHKKLVGGGTMNIVNQTVPRALKNLGYSQPEIDDIVAYIDKEKTILGAPRFKGEHKPVFACSMGDNPIHYLGHVKMMAAVQPFLSGAISKTVNMPEDVSVEDVEQLHVDAWQMGLKAIAIYRDNCKVAQPLSMAKKGGNDEAARTADPAAHKAMTVNDPALALAPLATAAPVAVPTPVAAASAVNDAFMVKGAVRREMPRHRNAKTFSFKVAGSKGYVTVGEFEDGTPGEVFMKIAKQGSTLAGVMDALAVSVSYGLQYGVPLKSYVHGLTNMSFAPAGITDDPEIRTASSLVDYIFRRQAMTYLSFDDRLELGLASIDDMPDEQTSLLGDGALLDDGAVEETAAMQQPAPTPAAPALALAPAVAAEKAARPAPKPAPALVAAEAPKPSQTAPAAVKKDDTAPMCYNCGNQTQRSGSCYVCTSCGSTTGCS